MSARISKTQASRNKLQGLIREADQLKAQHIKALKAAQSDDEYQALEDQIKRQKRLLRELRDELRKERHVAADTNELFAARIRHQIAQRDEAICWRNNLDIEVQNLNQAVRIRDGKLFDYRVLTALLLSAAVIDLGLKYLPGLF